MGGSTRTAASTTTTTPTSPPLPPTPAPTPSPTPIPTPSPTPAPTAWPTFSQHLDHEKEVDILEKQIIALEALVDKLVKSNMHLLEVSKTAGSCEITCKHPEASAGNDPALRFTYK